MATIWSPTSPLARCSTCGVQQQFHAASDVPHSADRDHPFVAETIDDFEPGDLTPEQLVRAISLTGMPPGMRLTGWHATDHQIDRAGACRTELKARVRAVFGVDWDDLMGAIEG